MRDFVSILTFLICINAKAQIKPGTYSVRSDTSISVQLVLSEDCKFTYYDSRSSSHSLWIMTYGEWRVQKDTLFLSFKWLKQRVHGDTTINPVNYTQFDGTVVTVRNAIELVDIKEYIIDNSVLHSVADGGNNKPSSWGNFDFVFKNDHRSIK
jgi:hypothetical protein